MEVGLWEWDYGVNYGSCGNECGIFCPTQHIVAICNKKKFNVIRENKY